MRGPALDCVLVVPSSLDAMCVLGVSGKHLDVDQRRGAFLERHGEALSALRPAPGVEDIRLDFPIDFSHIDR